MKIRKSTLMWSVIGVLFIIALFLTFKAGASGTGTSTGSAIDMTGWTENEKMNYEMHGVIPTRAKSSVSGASTGAGMVGGC